jgi:hypothetical protein
MLNNTLVLRLSECLSDRVRREAGPDAGAQVDRAYRLALGRLPSPPERERAARAAGEHGLAVVCRALFNSNEFLFID